MALRQARPLVFLCAVLAAASAPCAKLGYSLVFPRLGTSGCVFPVRVTVTSGDKPLQGNVVLEDSEFSVLAPVDLPQGATQSIVLYVRRGQGFDELRLKLEAGVFVPPVAISGGMEGRVPLTLVYIGDTPGALNPLAASRARPPFMVDSCRPEDAPERAVGYDAIQCVVLGDGAERLTDAAVAALRRYVLGGGTLLFSGAGGAPVVNDPRWSGFCPVGKVRTVPGRTDGALVSVFSAPSGRSLAVLEGQADRGSEATVRGGRLWAAQRSVGRGVTVFWAFHPFDPAVREWPGLRDGFRGIVGPRAPVADDTGMPWQRPGGHYGGEGDAFQLTLPDAKVVLGALAVYCLMVVPACLFGLNRLGKATWSWAALPLASLFFSFVVMSSATGVTQAGQGRASRGEAFFDSRSQEGLYRGVQEVFFPKPGVYDLKLKGAEYAQGVQSWRFQQSGLSPWRGRIIDVGEYAIPKLDVPAMAFRELELQQQLPSPGAIVARTVPGGIELTNRTSLSFVNGGTLRLPGQELSFAELKPGQTVVLPRKGQGQATQGGRALFSAATRSLAVGMAEWEEAGSSSGVVVHYTLDVERGP